MNSADSPCLTLENGIFDDMPEWLFAMQNLTISARCFGVRRALIGTPINSDFQSIINQLNWLVNIKVIDKIKMAHNRYAHINEINTILICELQMVFTVETADKVNVFSECNM